MQKHIAVFIFSISIFTASQSTIAAGISLSWNECVERAIRNNADLKSAIATKESLHAQVGVSRGGFFPQINGNLGYDKSNAGVFSNTSSQYSATLSGKQNLFAGFQDLGKLNQALANAQNANAQLQITKAKISYELKSAYENLLYSKEYSTLTKEIIRRRKENLQLVELQFKGGRENKGSVYLSEAYLNQALYDDLQATNIKRVAAANLAKSLGDDEFLEYDISEEIPSQEPSLSVPNFKDLALKTPDYEQAKTKEESSDAAFISSRSSFFPSLDLTGSIGRTGAEFFPNSQKNRWALGINLSIPFVSGGKDYYALKSSSLTWSAAENDRVNASRQILAKLEQVYANFIEASAKLKVDESFKKASTTRAEIARKRYNNGLMTFEDWDIIENDLIIRQKTYLQSKKERIISEAAWEQAQGKGVIP